MTVSIDIDLDALAAKMEIGQLRLMLESLGDDVDFDLDLDGELGDTLEKLSGTMEDISERFNSDMDETITRLENLQFDDVNVVQRGDGNSGGDTGSDSGDSNRSSVFPEKYIGDGNDSRSRKHLRSARRQVESIGQTFDDVAGQLHGFNRPQTNDIDSNIPDFSYDEENAKRAFKVHNRPFKETMGRMGMDIGDLKTNRQNLDLFESFNSFGYDESLFPNMSRGLGGGSSVDIGGGRDGKRGGILGMILNKGGDLVEITGDLKKGFRKIIPSMSTWLNLLGAAIPALGAMAVQAAGVAAAMGSIALAGGAMIGLGLLGHGDSMAESFRNAGDEVDDLKKGLFDAFEPAADLFAPTQSEFFDYIPGQMDRVQQSMQGLLVFKEDFFGMFRGLTEFTAEFFNLLASNSDKIGEMNERFSKILGSGILDFFEWLIESAYQNQQMLIQLGVALKKFGIALYNIFLLVGKAVQMLSGLFNIFVIVSKILNNRLIAGMVAIVAVMYMVSSVVGVVIGSMTMLATVLGTGLIPLFSSMFVYLSTYIFQTLTATMANYGLAASIANVTAALGTLMAMSGIGLLVAGLGIGIGKLTGMLDMGSSGNYNGSSYGGAGMGGTTINEGDTVNVDIGKADNATMEKFSDMRGGSGTRGPTGGSYT